MTSYQNTGLKDSIYLFHQGTNYCAGDLLGAHLTENGVVFRTWAPNAKAIHIIGDFCNWECVYQMGRISENGVWEGYIPCEALGDGAMYKFCIETESGDLLYKADPYARATMPPPETASVWRYPVDYHWGDQGWLDYRKQTYSADGGIHQPINIYEVHLGSWKRNEDGSYYTYRQLAQELPAYVKKMGYTHVEFLPITEYPFDGSWGYQASGYYAPTARYGAPEDCKALIDALHQAGIGVILDWVPAHFPKDAFGLYEFDGKPLYEFQDPSRKEHRGWGTRMFDVGRNEVRCFLISAALYWIREFHVDGLRSDAVAAMLYLDYDRMPWEWHPNRYGDNRSLESIAFFQSLNGYLQEYYPDILRFAEESGDFGSITRPASEGGLGFTYKWNMGWMNDTLTYVPIPFDFRQNDHRKLTFSLLYAFDEQYCLPISHDEVVHGKKSLLDRMDGDYWRKFAHTRAYLGYMISHPGKKLLFMGSELGQFSEWDYAKSVEWFLGDYDAHASFQRYVADLNHFYLANPPLYDNDQSWEGFQWMDADNAEQSVLSYVRYDRAGNALLIVVNFRPWAYENYKIGAPTDGIYEEIFNSDKPQYGGSGVDNTSPITTLLESTAQGEYSLPIRLPPLGFAVFRCTKALNRPKPKPKAEKKSTATKTAKKPSKKSVSKAK